MILEVLNRNAWDELKSIPDDVVPIPSKECSIAIVARNEAREIIGRVYLVFPPTEIGMWVRPDMRGSTVMVRLQKKLQDTMKAAGMRKLYACLRYGTCFVPFAKRWGFKRELWRQWSKEL